MIADELRAAATIIRQRAEQATPGSVLTNPDIAEPLAQAMDAVAFCVAMDADLIHRVGYEHVLAVARAINGEANRG